jgi:hypothetical protein
MKSSGLAVMVAGTLIASGTALRAGDDAAEAASGVRVRVHVSPRVDQPGKWRRVTGTLTDSGPDGLVLTLPDERRVTIPRVEIRRMEVSRGRHRGKGALVGAAIGLGVGLAVSGAAGATCDGWGCLGAGFLLVVGTPAATATGAGVGAAVGRERWRPVEAGPRPRLTVVPTVGRSVGARLAFSF